MCKHETAVVIGKAIGMFSYMVMEHGLGYTRYRSTLGLAKAAALGMLGIIVNRFWKRPIEPQERKP